MLLKGVSGSYNQYQYASCIYQMATDLCAMVYSCNLCPLTA